MKWILYKHSTWGYITHKVFQEDDDLYTVRFDFEVFDYVLKDEIIDKADNREELIKKYPEYFV
jgi:hypothetical protein